MITSKDVALKAGVSVSTVSRAFSRPDLINQETRELVFKISSQLGYIPNSNARTLKTKKSNTVGLIISDINNYFYLSIPRGLGLKQSNSKYHFLVSFSAENSKIEEACIQTLLSNKSEVIIFTPTGDCSEKSHRMLTNDSSLITLQLFRRKFDDIDSVTIDDELGSYLATKELLANGHRNIVLVDYDISIPTGRKEGYIKAFNEFNIKYNVNNIIKVNVVSDFDKELFAKLDAIKPTAIIPVSNVISNSIFEYLKYRNLKIKDDISVVAYDDTDATRAMNITSIVHPLDDLVDVVDTAIHNREMHGLIVSQHYKIKPYLIRRESVKKI